MAKPIKNLLWKCLYINRIKKPHSGNAFKILTAMGSTSTQTSMIKLKWEYFQIKPQYPQSGKTFPKNWKMEKLLN